MSRISLVKGGKVVAGKVKSNSGGKSTTKKYGAGTFVPNGASVADYGTDEDVRVAGNGQKDTAAATFQAVKKARTVQPSIISSENGLSILNQAKKKEAMLTTPPPMSATPSDQVAQAEQTRSAYGMAEPSAGTATGAPAPAAGQKAAPAKASTDSVTMVNPATEAMQTIGNPQANEPMISRLKNEGYQMAESNLSSPLSIDENPDVVRAQREAATAEKQMRNYMSQFGESMLSDTEMRSEVRSISSVWDARIADMQAITERRAQAIRTLGERTGMRYTGGMGGVLGGIISEEERQGILRIGELEGKKQEAIISAKQAMRNQNYNTYVSLISKAEAISKEKVDALKDLKTAQQEKQDKLEEEKKNLEYDALIAEQLGTGLTTAKDVFAALGGKVPFDRVLAITKEIPQPEQFTLGTNEVRFDASGKEIARGPAAQKTGGGGVRGLAGTPGAPGKITPAMYTAISDALAGIKFPSVDAQERADAAVGGKLANGDIEGAKKLILQYAQNSFGETTGQVMIGYRQGLESLDTIESGLKMLEDAGIDTNLLAGFAQKSAESIGQTDYDMLGKNIGDPKLARVANDIALAIISFRRATSGAAFTESEGKAYADVFPSIGREQSLNTEKIASLRQNFNNGIDAYLSFRISGYDELFKEVEQASFEDMSNADLIGDITGDEVEGSSPKGSASDTDFWGSLNQK